MVPLLIFSHLELPRQYYQEMIYTAREKNTS